MQFLLKVSCDVSSSIPSIEEFLLEVTLLSQEDHLKKVRRSLQAQPKAFNQTVANVLSKGSRWEESKAAVVENYRSFLRNTGGEGDTASFVEHLLTHFATRSVSFDLGTDFFKSDARL